MTVMGSRKAPDATGDRPETKGIKEASKEIPDSGSEPSDNKESMFSGKNIVKDTPLPASEVSAGTMIGLKSDPKSMVITVEDKVAFLDSVVNNTRFELNYALFGGRIRVKIRSLTSEEVQALSAWVVKEGVEDPTGQMAGKFRKYLLAAQIARYNEVDMPPLEAPLFATLESDGKTVKKPGWIERSHFWDDKGSGIIQALINCLNNFDSKYSTLCSKADDENFWNPDTP